MKFRLTSTAKYLNDMEKLSKEDKTMTAATTITAKVQELQELKRMQEELTATIEAVTDEIKAVMGDQEELSAGAFRITWKPVTTSRIDTTALKKELPEVAARYLKTTTSRRFCVN